MGGYRAPHHLSRAYFGREDFSVGISEVPPHGEGTRHTIRMPPRCGYSSPARAAPSSVLNTGDEPVKLYFLYVPGGEAQAILDAEFR